MKGSISKHKEDMQIITADDTLVEYQKKMSHNRKVRAQAKAVLQRAKEAGIPEKYMRINKESFIPLVDNYYHNDVNKLVNSIYDDPLKLLKKEFIVIDGGDVQQRKSAGFAVLFRLIACDQRGMHWENSKLAHQLQSLKVFGTGEASGRNDITEICRNVGILFISECSQGDFRPNFETGRFYDEILSYRDDYRKPTIISFTNPLPSGDVALNSENAMIDLERFGQYIGIISKSHKKTDDERFFTIRVKENGRK